MRFNAPPNWPAPPPGWTPPPGWQPDPSWPRPPPGWQLWVPDEAPRRRKGLLIGAIVAAVALVAIVAVVRFLVLRDVKPSDEEQIRSVLASEEDAWNKSDFDKFWDITCKSVRESDEFKKFDFQNSRDGLGHVVITVKSVEINGDKATAHVELNYENTDDSGTHDEEFVKENGEWKECSKYL